MTRTGPGILFVVGLPIGNPKDITQRAIDTLSDVDIIAAEDTRMFQDLSRELSLKIAGRIYSHHEHNESESTPELIRELQSGKTVALVSDAGTPRLSDPGFQLLKSCEEKHIPIIPIPGVSALTTLISVSHLGGNGHFYFAGFLPSKSSERKKALIGLKSKGPLALFESPHRIYETAVDILETLGDRSVVIGREMTKPYEEYFRGLMSSFIENLKHKEPRGEYTILLEAAAQSSEWGSEEIENFISTHLDKGWSQKELIEQLKLHTNETRKQLYARIEKLKNR